VSRKRLLAVALFFGLAFAGLFARAVKVCVLNHEIFGPQAVRQALGDLQLSGPRGDIVDRAGAPLAVSVQVPSAYARPRALEDRARVAERLATALKMRFEEVFPLLTGERRFVWLKRWLSPDEEKAVRSLGDRGISVVLEPRRYYPGRELAAHVLGFVGHDERGLEGIERTFDEQLRGAPLTFPSMRDARGRHLLISGVLPPATAGAGQTLVLTIDRVLQHIAEEALARAAQKSGAKGGSVVVLEPHGAEILALASYPRFNPNAFANHDGSERRNRAATDAFEPGSTAKVFTLGIALETGAATLSERIFCERGRWRVGTHRISDLKPHGRLTVAEVLRFSSNIGAAKIGRRLGARRLYEGLSRFFFGSRTGVPVPGESPGVLHPAARWREADVVTHSYGYGLAVTALQLAQAYAAIANGGEVVRPRLVRAVLDREGKVLHAFGREVRGRALSAATARTLTRLMVGVTQRGGTGRRAALPGYEVAGKTGTAMKIGTDGKYTPERRTVLFAGFAPADSPRLVAVVTLDEPRGRVTGGEVAAPAWREIAEGALRLWAVPPTHPAPTVAAATRARPSPAPRRAGPGVPDLQGLGVASAARAAARAGLAIEVVGSGRAVRQDPAPGAAVAPGASVRVVFAREGGS
jgi:cell division protein FtsI (penicillin-binding protein 3)